MTIRILSLSTTGHGQMDTLFRDSCWAAESFSLSFVIAAAVGSLQINSRDTSDPGPMSQNGGNFLQ